MKPFYLFLFLAFIPAFTASAQGENNVWAFGKGLGLDFTSGNPVSIGTSLYTVEGSASVCGKNGKLKFYSDGQKVFNRNHKQMPDGFGLLTDLSMTQGVAIVPLVNDTNKFYLFVLHSTGNTAPYYLNYSVVDMSLDGGLGNIISTQKNITIDDSLSEKMIVTKASGCAYWLIVHKYHSPSFHAFKIEGPGIHEKPVVSNTIFTGTGKFGIGEMKVSPDNKKIALANWVSRGQTGSIELFNFDSTSGKVDGYALIDSSRQYAAYGISFSPDNKKLYAAYGEDEPRPPYPLVQYNITPLPDIGMVRASKTTLATAYNWAGMRLYRDKIYVLKSANVSCAIGVINDPDNIGTACNFRDSLFVFYSSTFGLGNPVPETLPVRSRKIDTSACIALDYAGVPGYASYTWSDGYSGYSRKIEAPARYWVKSSNGSCGAEIIDTLNISKKEFKMNLGEDIALCKTNSAILNCPVRDAQYLWSNGATTPSIEVYQSDVYWVKVAQGDCIASDTIQVSVGNCEKCILIPNSFTPDADGRNDIFHPIITCPVLRYQIKIFNRYGQHIFSSGDPAKGWDGHFNGQQLEIGTYFYLINVTFNQPGAREELFKGDINLLR